MLLESLVSLPSELVVVLRSTLEIDADEGLYLIILVICEWFCLDTERFCDISSLFCLNRSYDI